MESSGTTPDVGTNSRDLDEWSALRDLDGPVVSVYLDTTVDDATSPKEIDLRWRSMRASLEAEGAPVGALDAVEGHVEGAHARGGALVVMASESGTLLHRELDPPRIDDRFSFGPLPLLGPLLTWMQAREPYLVVVCDHLGAEIAVSDPTNGASHETVGGTDSEAPLVNLAQPGGWSQGRYQRRVRNKWKANAGEAAQRVQELVTELQPRFVAVAGDVRAVQLLRDQLPAGMLPLLRDVSGTRAHDRSDVDGDEIGRLARTAAAEDTMALTQQLRQELGQQDLGVVGAAATLEALAQARVDTLLVHDHPDDRRTAWVGVDTHMASMEKQDVKSTGSAAVHKARLVDVAIWQAMATGADVRVTPNLAVLEDGVGALLRH